MLALPDRDFGFETLQGEAVHLVGLATVGGGGGDDNAGVADFEGAQAVDDLDSRSRFRGFEFAHDPLQAALGHRGIRGVGDSLDGAAAEGVTDVADEDDDRALAGVLDAGTHGGDGVRVDGAVP